MAPPQLSKWRASLALVDFWLRAGELLAACSRQVNWRNNQHAFSPICQSSNFLKVFPSAAAASTSAALALMASRRSATQ